MLIGQKIIVWTDHINLTFPDTRFTSDRVLRQRLLIEEYSAEVKYIKGERNVAADAVSRLPIDEEEEVRAEEVMLNRKVNEFGTCPVSVEYIETAQEADEELQRFIAVGHPTKV